MGFKLDQVVPWGRSYEEYVSMFGLSAADLKKRILGCGDGPAGFNAELTRGGGHVVSVDPVYQFSADAIKRRIEETSATVLDQTRKNQTEFVWRAIKNVEELGRVRMAAMERFLEDYPRGRRQGRYVLGDLPALAFADDAFELALCSHFLFLYSEHFDADFHFRSIVELCRVAGEARIFPLLELGARKSRHVDPVVSALEVDGYECRIETVDYEFQKGGDQMLSVKRRR